MAHEVRRGRPRGPLVVYAHDDRWSEKDVRPAEKMAQKIAALDEENRQISYRLSRLRSASAAKGLAGLQPPVVSGWNSPIGPNGLLIGSPVASPRATLMTNLRARSSSPSGQPIGCMTYSRPCAGAGPACFYPSMSASLPSSAAVSRTTSPVISPRPLVPQASSPRPSDASIATA
ncbi:unnamed protein product, partial [Polarella glacialis]